MTKNVEYLLKSIFAPLLALALAMAFVPPALAVDNAEVQRQIDEKNAQADELQQQVNQRQMTAYELQQQIEERQEAYAAALDEVDTVNADIEANEDRIAKLEREIPKQEARSNAAAREMYKLQQESLDMIDLLLGSTSFEEFISQLEYVNRITQAQVNEILKLNALKAEVDQAQTDLKTLKIEAEMRAEDARVALLAAQEAQAEVQQRIAEESRMIAEIAAMAEELAKQVRDNDQGSISGGEPPSASTENQGGGEPGNGGETPSAPSTPSAPDMSGDEASFVAEWAPRIDAYLAGSPLAGQGTTFARAAYQYGVDPRFSPAISFTESGKGMYCFLPHNAWGWGSSSWGSWEEAIYDHVAGLSRGYGGQISVEGAQKYCPPNWQAWYDRTLGQMQLI